MLFTTVRSRRWPRLALVMALATFLVLIVAACGSSSDQTASPQPEGAGRPADRRDDHEPE